MKHTKSLLAVFLALIFGAFVGSVVAQTQNNNPFVTTSGIVVSPPTFEVTAKPGETVNHKIRVENLYDRPATIVVEMRNFLAKGEDGSVDLTEEETTHSLASWIKVSENNITIPSKKSYTFSIAITIPPNAEPGGHFGSVIFRSDTGEKIAGSGASVSQETASLVLVKIAGKSLEELKIDSFGATQKFYEEGPVKFEARVTNLGNVHLKPVGTVLISNMFGQKVDSVTLDNKNVLPGAVRRLEGNWPTKWRLGRYTATLSLTYGEDLMKLTNVSHFVVFPYRLIAIISLAVLTVVYLLWRSRRRWSAAVRMLLTGK